MTNRTVVSGEVSVPEESNGPAAGDELPQDAPLHWGFWLGLAAGITCWWFEGFSPDYPEHTT